MYLKCRLHHFLFALCDVELICTFAVILHACMHSLSVPSVLRISHLFFLCYLTALISSLQYSVHYWYWLLTFLYNNWYVLYNVYGFVLCIEKNLNCISVVDEKIQIMEWVGAFLSHTIMHIPTLTNPREAQMTIGSADCLQEMFCINFFCFVTRKWYTMLPWRKKIFEGILIF